MNDMDYSKIKRTAEMKKLNTTRWPDYRETKVAFWKIGKKHNKSETRQGFPLSQEGLLI